MSAPIPPIVNAAALVDLRQNENLVLIDARSGPGAYESYLRQHLALALFVELEKQLADIQADVANGGRHPLPDPKKFASLIGDLGIDADSHVVVYDDKNGANAAARFWWMMRSLGHKKIQVLNGGFDAGIAAGYSTGSGQEKQSQKSVYPFQEWNFPTVTMAEVQKAADHANSLVIDVREKKRYDGEHESIDLVAGHIPGAINLPFTSNLTDGGLFLSPLELKQQYEKILAGRSPGEVIVHCGSGVTACHTILAMDSAGLDIPKLYTGSWSEWSRNKMPIATSTKE